MKQKFILSIFKTYQPGQNYAQEGAVLAVLVLVVAVVMAKPTVTLARSSDIPVTFKVAPPLPPALEYRPVAREDAIRINSLIPFIATAAAARPFRMIAADPIARQRALECLTTAIYYEAGQEPIDGQRAVAQVILNRVRHPAFPSSVCGVIYQGSERDTGCQFSFTCDGSMARLPMITSWNRARKVAAAALAGSVFPLVGTATHYHANYVLPYWASSLAKTAVVGAHLFYRWTGGWGQPTAFHQAYSGNEASPVLLRAAALKVEVSPATPVLVDTAVPVPSVTQLEGAVALGRPDEDLLHQLFSRKVNSTVKKTGKAALLKVAKIDVPGWKLSDSQPNKNDGLAFMGK